MTDIYLWKFGLVNNPANYLGQDSKRFFFENCNLLNFFLVKKPRMGTPGTRKSKKKAQSATAKRLAAQRAAELKAKATKEEEEKGATVIENVDQDQQVAGESTEKLVEDPPRQESPKKKTVSKTKAKESSKAKSK